VPITAVAGACGPRQQNRLWRHLEYYYGYGILRPPPHAFGSSFTPSPSALSLGDKTFFVAMLLGGLRHLRPRAGL